MTTIGETRPIRRSSAPLREQRQMAPNPRPARGDSSSSSRTRGRQHSIISFRMPQARVLASGRIVTGQGETQPERELEAAQAAPGSPSSTGTTISRAWPETGGRFQIGIANSRRPHDLGQRDAGREAQPGSGSTSDEPWAPPCKLRRHLAGRRSPGAVCFDPCTSSTSSSMSWSLKDAAG